MLEALLVFLSILRVASPLILTSFAGLISERSGVVQIALEGFLLIGALTAAIFTYYFHSPIVGLAAAAGATALGGLLFGLFVVVLKADQIIAGTAFNLFAFGLAPFITKIIFHSSGSTPNLVLEERFVTFPFYFVVCIVLLVSFIFYLTKLGIFLNFSGEKPEVLTICKISVIKFRIGALMCCGALAGMGGALLSTFLSSSYAPNMTAGRGFISLAAVIFGRWKPLPTLFVCLFFAATDIMQIYLQKYSSFIPIQLIQHW